MRVLYGDSHLLCNETGMENINRKQREEICSVFSVSVREERGFLYKTDEALVIGIQLRTVEIMPKIGFLFYRKINK